MPSSQYTPAKGELYENKTYIRIDIAGPGHCGCPSKCRDRDGEVFAVAVFAAPGTHDTCVNGCGTNSRVTFRNPSQREIKDLLIIVTRCCGTIRRPETCD